jgi:hypothetical protein
MRRRPVVIMLLIGVCAFAQPAGVPAAAGAQPSVIANCNVNGRLTQRYSIGQLRAALSTMPADVKEYTNCYDVIQRTLLAQLGSQNSSTPASGSSSGGSFFSGPVIVVIVLLVLAGAAFGALALRRRSA